MDITTRRARTRRVGWTRVVTWVVLVAGLAIAVAGAATRFTVVDERDQDSFRATAVNVQTIVATQLARQDDLLDSVAGMVSAEPAMTNAEFLSWYTTARIAERFPGGIGISYIARVPAADLAAFAARQVTDPVTGLVASDEFAVYPAQDAGSYCLTRLGVWEINEIKGFTIPAGLDYCASELVPGTVSSVPQVLAQATADAAPALVPMDQLSPGVLAEFLPVYAGTAVPETPELRQEAVVGWVAGSFDADALVDLAMAGQTGLAVAVDRSSPEGVERIASAGDVDASASSTTLPVSSDARWTVTVHQTASTQGVSATSQATVVFISAMLITLLLVALIRVLSGSRERALAMVKEKTEQLEYQALHDTLTGLPNRALLLDRASQMLARQERSGGPIAALFVDLDEFKAVNDRYGHAAGDAFLCAVADRIDSLFRGSDTVGRLGGDEFVVLLEGGPFAAGDGAEVAAQRILDVLADPVELDGITVPVSCSVGVAKGPRASADDLLRDADTAMYRAKVGGKGRYAVFTEGPRPEPLDGPGVPSLA